jgi:lysophospholipase L1-like esterase
MDQQACISPSWGTVTALKLVFAAFDMPQQGEVDRPVTATGTAAIFVPGVNSVPLTGGAGVASGSTTLNVFPSGVAGTNAVSLGQLVTSAGGGIAGGAYVTGVANSFVAGSGNTPANTTVTINTGTTAATANGQSFTFSGSFVPVKFGGKRSFTVEPGHDVVTSDAVGVELPPGTWFMVRTSASMSGVGLQSMDVPVSARLSITGPAGTVTEFSNRSTTLNDQTMTPVGLSNSGGGYWGPVTLLGLVSVPAGQLIPGAALILGDSIAAGTGDTPDASGFEGYIQRSLEAASVPFITAARGSTTAYAASLHGDGQYALSVDTGVTDVLLELGRNDVSQFNITAAKAESYVEAIAARYVSAGKRVWCFSIPATTYSSDGWTTLAGQAFPAAVANTGTSVTNAGATQVTLASLASISVGLSVALNGSTTSQAIGPGTTVTAINSGTSVITLSAPTNAAIPASTTLYFGTQNNAVGVEAQREAYNSFARQNWTSGNAYCSGLIDVDAILADHGGSFKWRVDLGQASVDGVHPTAALHQAVVNAQVINAGMFAVP